jgi:hypothetical protein
MMTEDFIKNIRYPNEPSPKRGYVALDDRMSYEDAVVYLSHPIIGNPELLLRLEAEKAKREKQNDGAPADVKAWLDKRQ